MNDKLLKTAFSEFYLSLIMTQNYVKHNLLGFQKIMKKFDKNLNCKVNWITSSRCFDFLYNLFEDLQEGAKWQDETLSASELKKSQEIDKMLSQVSRNKITL